MSFLKLLSTIGLLFGIGGAVLIALNIDMFVIGYILFLISSLAWVWYAISTKQLNLFLLNFVFGIINSIGLYNFI